MIHRDYLMIAKASPGAIGCEKDIWHTRCNSLRLLLVHTCATGGCGRWVFKRFARCRSASNW
jgi:hypothetical protein